MGVTGESWVFCVKDTVYNSVDTVAALSSVVWDGIEQGRDWFCDGGFKTGVTNSRRLERPSLAKGKAQAFFGS